MKIKVKYSLSTSEEIVDLEEYGYDSDVKWSDLTREEQYEITDALAMENFVIPSAEETKDE
jgi:hypothetical protein